MQLEFLLCGSPNDSFYSQAAMYRIALDSFGGPYRDARLVLCLGDREHVALPDRWRPYFNRIDVQRAPVESFLEHGDGSDFVFELVDDSADASFICDADTLMLRPFPDDFLDDLLSSPFLGGVLAHLPPPLVDLGNDYRDMDSEDFWAAMARHVLGRDIELAHRYTLLDAPDRCPFYINYGFVAGTPTLLKALHRELGVVQPRVRAFLDNDFYGQIGIALAVERGQLPIRSLPMRFNFPNDPRADARHAVELDEVCIMHYLRRTQFDRHMIFASEVEYDKFMRLPLEGSNLVFQRFVSDLTGGKYPFPLLMSA